MYSDSMPSAFLIAAAKLAALGSKFHWTQYSIDTFMAIPSLFLIDTIRHFGDGREERPRSRPA